MKFKILVIILDIVLFLFFISVFIMPVFMGVIDLKTFLTSYWFFPPIFIALLVVINFLYLKNKNIIENVEAGDWMALCLNLEEEVFEKRNLNFKNIKLLSEVQLLLSDFKGLQRLETFVRANKGEYLTRLATNFAGGKLLSGQYDELYTFTSNLVKSGNKNEWIIFYVPFSLQMQKQHAQASDEFAKLVGTFTEPILNLMTDYFYYDVLKSYNKLPINEQKEKVSELKGRFCKEYSRTTWQNYIAKKKENIHILVFKKVIDDASTWIYQ